MKWLELHTEILRTLRFGAIIGKQTRIGVGEDLSIGPLRSPTLHAIPILGRHGYVQSGLYSTKEGEIKLHALTEVGFQELIEYGYAPEHIRTPYLPSRRHLKHDREVTNVLRVSVEDCERLNYPYYFHDELELKKIFSGKSLGKERRSFPDIAFGVLAGEKEFELPYEIDMGTETVMYIKERKLRVHEGNMLFICKDERRIRQIAEVSKPFYKVNILFSTFQDFYANGLFVTDHWQNMYLENCRMEDVL